MVEARALARAPHEPVRPRGGAEEPAVAREDERGGVDERVVRQRAAEPHPERASRRPPGRGHGACGVALADLGGPSGGVRRDASGSRPAVSSQSGHPSRRGSGRDRLLMGEPLARPRETQRRARSRADRPGGPPPGASRLPAVAHALDGPFDLGTVPSRANEVRVKRVRHVARHRPPRRDQPLREEHPAEDTSPRRAREDRGSDRRRPTRRRGGGRAYRRGAARGTPRRTALHREDGPLNSRRRRDAPAPCSGCTGRGARAAGTARNAASGLSRPRGTTWRAGPGRSPRWLVTRRTRSGGARPSAGADVATGRSPLPRRPVSRRRGASGAPRAPPPPRPCRLLVIPPASYGRTMPDAIVERDGHVLIITMNRPERMNALSGAMLVRMYDAYERGVDGRRRPLHHPDRRRRQLLLGRRPAGDGGRRGRQRPRDRRAGAHGGRPRPPSARRCSATTGRRKPIIAAVEGVAIAGGTEILQATEIRVAGESARFGVSEARWSLYPMGGSAVRLPPPDPVHARGGDPAHRQAHPRARGARDRPRRPRRARRPGAREGARDRGGRSARTARSPSRRSCARSTRPTA